MTISHLCQLKPAWTQLPHSQNFHFGGCGQFLQTEQENWEGSSAESSTGNTCSGSWCSVAAGEEQAADNCNDLTPSQVPVPLTDNRRRFLAMKWLITECRENKHRRTLMPEKLSQELLLAFNNEGPIIKKKHVLHKMAEANRAYAHFRWW